MPSSATGEHRAVIPLQGTVRQRHIFIVNYHVRAARAEQSDSKCKILPPLPFLYGLYYPLWHLLIPLGSLFKAFSALGFNAWHH